MNISLHIANILKEKELEESVVKSYLTTAADGKRYNVIYYALEMILAVGFRVRGVRGTQFRQWANRRTWRSCGGLRTRQSDAARIDGENER